MPKTEPHARQGAPAQRPRPRTYLPLGIDVAGLRCLVVGGGRVGARKARTLADAGARVTVLAPDIHDRLRPLVADGAVRWIRAAYDRSHLDGHALVVAATSDPALNVRIGRDAEEQNILPCLVSPGRESRVIFPATYERDGVTVAVHTNGRDCARSRRVRDELARVLPRWEPPRLAVFGVRRPDVPPEVFRRLGCVRVSSDDLDGAEVVALSTCRRWECWFVAPSPRPVVRDLRRLVHERAGVFLESYGPALTTRSGPGAFHHLLRVAAGLESPLVGETEIVGQLRRAVEAAHLRDDSPLRRVFTSALCTQKAIRKESGLRPAGRDWAWVATERLRRRIGPLRGRRVLLVGCGRLGEAVAARLAGAGAEVSAFSGRAAAGVDWCRRRGLVAHDLARLADFLPRADAIVVARELPPEIRKMLHDPAGPPLVDFAAGVEGLPLSGRDAARAAQAGKLALGHALQWFRRGRRADAAPRQLRVGGRPSHLSRAQFRELAGFLEVLLPDTELHFIAIDTPGDRDKRTPLPEVRDDDFFTRDVDAALRRRDIDLAVHSAKDLPARVPVGLRVAAVLPAFAPWECLVSRDGTTLAHLPAGARVGTSSDRRRRALLALRPDVTPADVRGNVPERLRQLDDTRYDALVLAAAGLVRLGLADRISQVFAPDEFPPAPGQGSLALVVREDAADLLHLLAPLDVGERRGLPWA